MHPLYAKTGVDWVEVVVSRQEIESLDTAPAFGTLRTLLYDSETVKSFQGRLSISFDGYDKDPRELYEIPEVRRYIASLDLKFPYWFYFVSTQFGTLKLLACCLCLTEKVGSTMAQPNRNDLETFIIGHFAATNELFDNFHIDEVISKEISVAIGDYFS